MMFREVLEYIKEQLDYRLPESGKPLGHIVLAREQAEALIRALTHKSPPLGSDTRSARGVKEARRR